MSPCTWPELNGPMGVGVKPVDLMLAMLAAVIGFCKGVFTNDGMLEMVGNPLMIASITVSATPAVPRSSRLRANLTAVDCTLETLCPAVNPTNAPEAT